MSWLRLIVVTALAAVAVGCGGGLEEIGGGEELTSEQLIKDALNGIVESGQGGSAFGLVIQEAEAMKRDDPSKAALADELIAEAEQMMESGGDEAAVKAAAKAMLQKLESGGGGG